MGVGWACDGVGGVGMALGSYATIWDGKISGIRQSLRMIPDGDLLILSYSIAANQPLVGAASLGVARTRDMRVVVYLVERYLDSG